MIVRDLAVGFLFLVVVLNLLLTTAILRRMRVYEQERADNVREAGGPPVGLPVPEFRAQAVTGPVDHSMLRDRETLVAFLSSDCAPCRILAPQLARLAPSIEQDGTRLVVVIKHAPGQASAVLDAFSGSSATVVVEAPDTLGLASAFRPGASPSFFRVGTDGRLLAKGIDLGAVAPVAVTKQ